MDAIALVLCGSVVLLQVNPKPAWMEQVGRTTALIAVMGALAVAILPHVEDLIVKLLRWLPFPTRSANACSALPDRSCSDCGRSTMPPACSALPC